MTAFLKKQSMFRLGLAILLLGIGTSVACQMTLAGNKVITGVVTLPEGQKAFESTEIVVACVNAETDIPVETTVIMPKGSNQVTFQLNTPDPKAEYFIRTTLNSKGGDGADDAKQTAHSTQYSNLPMGGLSIMNHVYDKDAYWTGSGSSMTGESDNKAIVAGSDIKNITLELLPEPGLQGKTKEILASILTEGMTDLEKEQAVYQYIMKQLPLSFEDSRKFAKGEVQEFDNPLTEALLNNQVVWLGHSFAMEWLLENAGLESELVEAFYQAFNVTYVYNQVQIDGKAFYCNPLQATTMGAVDTSQVGHLTFRNVEAAQQYFKSKYFNFTDETITNMGAVVIRAEAVKTESAMGADQHLIRVFAGQQGSQPLKTSVLKGELKLPGGIVGPDRGLFITLVAQSGIKTNTTADDYIVDQYIYIPEGASSAPFQVTVPETGEPYELSFREDFTHMTAREVLRKLEFPETPLTIQLKP